MKTMILKRLLAGAFAVLIVAVLCQVAQAGLRYASVNYTSGGRGRQVRSSQGYRGRLRTLGFNHAYHRYGYSRRRGYSGRSIRSHQVRQQYYSQPRVIVIIIR